MFILKNLNIELKQTDSIVRKFNLKRSEHFYFKDFKYQSEAKQVNNVNLAKRSEVVIYKN